MQTLLQVVCKKGTSLRDAVVNDTKLDSFGLMTAKKQKRDRSHGWAKILSVNPGRRGAINIAWDANTCVLLCRIVNRGAAKPDYLLGDFVTYLFQRHSRRIQAVNIIPR